MRSVADGANATKLFGSGQLGFALKRSMLLPSESDGQSDGQSDGHWSLQWEEGAAEERAAGDLLRCGILNFTP